MVGELIRVQGVFDEGNTLLVDSIEVLLRDKTVGIVEVGKTTYINGVKITLHEVVQDNRCPEDAQCIEGGSITARFTLVSDTDTITRNIASDEVPTPFDTYTIAIEKTAPPRLSTIEPDPSAYVLTLRVANVGE